MVCQAGDCCDGDESDGEFDVQPADATPPYIHGRDVIITSCLLISLLPTYLPTLAAALFPAAICRWRLPRGRHEMTWRAQLALSSNNTRQCRPHEACRPPAIRLVSLAWCLARPGNWWPGHARLGQARVDPRGRGPWWRHPWRRAITHGALGARQRNMRGQAGGLGAICGPAAGPRRTPAGLDSGERRSKVVAASFSVEVEVEVEVRTNTMVSLVVGQRRDGLGLVSILCVVEQSHCCSSAARAETRGSTTTQSNSLYSASNAG